MPSNQKIKSSVDFLNEGRWRGYPAVQLRFDAETPATPEEYTEIILWILGSSKAKNNFGPGGIVRVYSFCNDDPGMGVFAQTMLDHGFALQLVLRSQTLPAWLPGLRSQARRPWLIAQVTSGPWFLGVDELWYRPDVITDKDDPQDILPGQAALYARPVDGRQAEVLSFCQKSPRMWALL